METLYMRISEILVKRNLSTYALEKGSGIGLGTFRSWETSVPSCDRLLKVAKYLDVSTDYLLGNTENLHSHKNDIVNITPALAEILNVLNKATGATVSIASNAKEDIKCILNAYHLDAVTNTDVSLAPNIE